jgi:hypothetical protein
MENLKVTKDLKEMLEEQVVRFIKLILIVNQ